MSECAKWETTKQRIIWFNDKHVHCHNLPLCGIHTYVRTMTFAYSRINRFGFGHKYAEVFVVAQDEKKHQKHSLWLLIYQIWGNSSVWRTVKEFRSEYVKEWRTIRTCTEIASRLTIDCLGKRLNGLKTYLKMVDCLSS